MEGCRNSCTKHCCKETCAKSKSVMQQTTSTTLDRRIKRFATSLKKDFAPEIAQNPSEFRTRLIGKLRVYLPRKRPGRKGSPEATQAAEIFEREYRAKGKQGNWHQIAKQIFADYATLPTELQKFRRYQLRSNVHGLRHELKARKKLA